MRVKSLICHTPLAPSRGALSEIAHIGCNQRCNGTGQILGRRDAKTWRSIGPLVRFRSGAQRGPECSDEYAVVLARIDIGNVRGVAEIGLPVADQMAIAVLADDG